MGDRAVSRSTSSPTTVTGLSTAGETEDGLRRARRGDRGRGRVRARARADVLHDLTPVDFAPTRLEPPDAGRASSAPATSSARRSSTRSCSEKRAERLAQAELRSQYLSESMDAQRERLRGEVVGARRPRLPRRGGRDARARRGRSRGSTSSSAGATRSSRLRAARHRASPGPVGYLGTALVGPPPASPRSRPSRRCATTPRSSWRRWTGRWSTSARTAGSPRTSPQHRDGRGFDIRSVRRDDGRPRARGPAHRGQGPRPGAAATSACAAPSGSPPTATATPSGSTSSTAPSRDEPRGDPDPEPGDGARPTTSGRSTTVTAYYIPGEAIEEAGEMSDDRRLIEDLIPVEAINEVAPAREDRPRRAAPAQAAPLVGAPAARGRPGGRLRDARARGRHAGGGALGRLLPRAVPLGRVGDGDRRGARARARRPTAASRRRCSTCSPAAARSRSRRRGSAARRPRSS